MSGLVIFFISILGGGLGAFIILTLLYIYKRWKRRNVLKQDKYFANPSTEIGYASYGPLAVKNYFVESVGKYCSFAQGVNVAPNHLMAVSTHAFLLTPYIEPFIKNKKQKELYQSREKCKIGNDVWIGRNVQIINGVTIGNGAIVGAGAIVTKDIPDYAIAVGVPARVVGYRFSEEVIAKLNQIKWWDWDRKKIEECYDDFLDIEVFINKHYKNED